MSMKSCPFLYSEYYGKRLLVTGSTPHSAKPLVRMVLLLDVNSEHVAHARRKYAFSDFAEKNPICDCLRSS